MAQLGDTVITGSLSVSNNIYGSVTCATNATNASKGWNGSSFASFGSNAFNSNSYLLASDCAVDSNKLNGFTASASSTANTVVVRDANQYIYGAYFNSNIGDENINSYADSPAIMFSSSDKWIRRTTKANLQTWLGLGSNAYNSTAFTTCTGTVTSIAFQCAGTDMSTITSSGTINLSANAWNQYATISTTTYPGACCTGTLTSSSGCAYDSAMLTGKAPSALCVACAGANGSGRAFGTAAVCSASCFVATSTVSEGYFGCAHWGHDPRTWHVYINVTTATADCDVYKAFRCATNGFKGFLTGACQGVTGQYIRDSDKRGANTLILNSNTSLSLGNYNMGACITISGTSTTTRNWCGFMIAGTYLP